MKNLKTKVGITLTALACFLTFGCNSNKQEHEGYGLTGKDPVQEEDQTTPYNSVIPTVPEEKYEPSPYEKCDFNKITEILEKFNNSALSYPLFDGRIVKFSYHNRDENEDSRLEVKISKQYSQSWDSVIIKDYGNWGLDYGDTISYVSQTTLGVQKLSDTKEFNFESLSEETQKKITEEYANILKDAPERLSKEYEMSVKSFEKDVLGVIKK